MSISDLNKQINERLVNLTPKERKYFSIMRAKYGVLFITSKPGVAKSAIGKSIANKMGFNYIDMRLTMNDESDFKYPYILDKEYESGTIKVHSFTVPEWAYDANSRPTIIHFEELNRAPQFVRNAALQILLEREIGKFKFNDGVFMMASGNLGDEDGTDVEELDSALNNRLIHINHTLSPDEWIKDFSNDQCHKMITSFIKAYPEKYYQAPTENTKAYATPRSWTMLSKFITENFGENASPSEFLPLLKEVASGYVGNSAMKFIQYCEDMIRISIQDVINRYDSIKNDLAKYNRDKNSELIQSLKEIDINDLSEKQLKNVVKFLKGVGDDEKMAYLLFVVDGLTNIGDNIAKFLLEFEDLLRTMKNINNG
jgi:hypothetical protein